MATIDVADVAQAIGRPISTSEETAQVTQWISDVELLIGARLGDLSALNQPLLEYVVREAVIARMRYRTDRNSARSTASEDDTDNGDEHYFLRILGPWWALLSPQGQTGAAAFSVRPYFVSDEFGSESWA